MLRIVSVKKYLSVVLAIIGAANASLFAQLGTVEAKNSFEIPEVVLNTFNLFDKDDILEISLMFDITTYMKDKPQEEYLDALLSYKYNPVDSINKKIRVRARGNYRYRECEFPPLRLNFRDTSFGFSDLDSLRNVKMVTHCFDSLTYQNYLMREYLVYKLYNIVTSYSFKARFMKVRYLDTGKDGLHSEQYGFLIEPLDRLLFRTRSVEIEDTVLTFNDVDPGMLNRLMIFQMMIGNSDWNLPMIHNFRIIKRTDTETNFLKAVPYDFDYSGFVNAHYSIPRTDLDLKSITDRVYLGPCRSEEELRASLDDFLKYKDAFIDEVRNFEYLDRTIRRELIDYINSFFKLYKNDVLLKQLLMECIRQEK